MSWWRSREELFILREIRSANCQYGFARLFRISYVIIMNCFVFHTFRHASVPFNKWNFKTIQKNAKNITPLCLGTKIHSAIKYILWKGKKRTFSLYFPFTKGDWFQSLWDYPLWWMFEYHSDHENCLDNFKLISLETRNHPGKGRGVDEVLRRFKALLTYIAQAAVTFFKSLQPE